MKLLSFKKYVSENFNGFNKYINESNLHQLHLEQLSLGGAKELKRAIDIIKDLQKQLTGKAKQKDVNVTMKWDGCIHEDTIIKTKDGDKTIKKIIEEFQNGIDNVVLTCDIKNNVDSYEKAIQPRINDNGKTWVEVEMENGEKIKVTEDHEFYTTNRGWVEAKNLTENDDVKEIERLYFRNKRRKRIYKKIEKNRKHLYRKIRC